MNIKYKEKEYKWKEYKGRNITYIEQKKQKKRTK